MNMNAVGIDVSKWKSTVAILRPGGKVVVKPFDVPHLLYVSAGWGKGRLLPEKYPSLPLRF